MMRLLLGLIGFGLIAMVGLAVYVRLVPITPETWHQASVDDAPGDYAGEKSFVAVRALTTSGEGVLKALVTAASATPRTEVIAGSVEMGQITFLTRSRLFGFPDFTTATVMEGPDGQLLQIYGRARDGKLDMGVNKARVEGWLKDLGPLIVAP